MNLSWLKFWLWWRSKKLPDPSTTKPFDEIEPPAFEQAQFGFSSLFTLPQFLLGLEGLDFERVAGIVWEDIEDPPGSGNYDWSIIDHYVIPACANGYNIHIVLKTGHPQGLVDEACYDKALTFTGTSTGVSGNRLVSCPLLPEHLSKIRDFYRAVIRRYCKGPGGSAMPGMTSGFRMHIQPENEATSKIFWNIDITSDGALAAQHYSILLKTAYEAKLLEGATNCKIILQGFPQVDNTAECIYDLDWIGRNCNTPATIRLRTFTQEILKYPQYFDVVDVHWFNYFYFLPGRVKKGTDWLRNECLRNGWDLSSKELWCNESTPAMISDPGATADGPEVLAAFYPYAADVVGSNGYLEPTVLYDSEGNIDEEGEPPCYFFGDYNANDIDRTFAIYMDDTTGAASPQQFYWTRNFVGINGTTWNGPVSCSLTPIALEFNVSVQWSATTGITYPFAVSSRAHKSTLPVTQDLLRYYYSNLDFLENDTSLSAAMQNPKHRIWFEAEEGIEVPKNLCDLMVNGYKRIAYIKFQNYFPGFSWDSLWWRFHGVVRLTGGTGPSDATFVHKPSWHSRNQLITFIDGHTGVNLWNGIAGVTGYQFNFANNIPKYVLFTTATNTLDDPNRADGAVICTDVTVAIQQVLGWTTARITEFVYEVIADVATVVTTTKTGAATYTIGDRTHTVSGSPVTHKSVAIMVEKVA